MPAWYTRGSPLSVPVYPDEWLHFTTHPRLLPLNSSVRTRILVASLPLWFRGWMRTGGRQMLWRLPWAFLQWRLVLVSGCIALFRWEFAWMRIGVGVLVLWVPSRSRRVLRCWRCLCCEGCRLHLKHFHDYQNKQTQMAFPTTYTS